MIELLNFSKKIFYKYLYNDILVRRKSAHMGSYWIRQRCVLL